MAVGWPQWPGANENFSLIIGMYFKILSEPNFWKVSVLYSSQPVSGGAIS